MLLKNQLGYSQQRIHEVLSRDFNTHLEQLGLPNTFHYLMVNDDQIHILTNISGNKVFLLNLASGNVEVTSYLNSDNHRLELKLFLMRYLQIGNSL